MNRSLTPERDVRSSLNLTEQDLAAFAKLKISPGMLTLARVERVTDGEAREKFGIRFPGDCAGVVFPYYIDGARVTARLRRDHPEIDADGKSQNKYISAIGDRRHLYLPPDYEPLLADPTIPVLFVEAEKSVLAIAEWSRRIGRRLLVLGTGGCWGWRGVVGIKTGVNGERKEDRDALPEVALIQKDRTAGILFDSNCATNPKVQKARTALKRQLEKQEAKVLLFDLPATEGVNGPDDFLAIAGDEAFADLLNRKAEKAPAVSADANDLRVQPLNDYGNALRLIAMRGADLRYFTPTKRWLIWDGRRWKSDESDQIRSVVQDCIVELASQALSARDEVLSRFAGRCLNSQRLASAIREAQPRLAILPDELDQDLWLLNFINGTVDLRTGEIREHRRGDFITKLVHYDYDATARCPRFLAFMERSVGVSLVPYLQRVCGYALTGVTSEKTNFLCLGPTDTGKSTFLSLFRDLFAEYATLILIDALMSRDEDNNSRADLADLRGARFAITSETDEGQRLREGKLKRISQGQGRIKSVQKYQNPIEFKETHKLFIDANHKPVVRGTDNAIWNRLSPVPFERPLAESEIDRNLPAKLREEAEGVIAWAVEGSRLWHQNGLGKPIEMLETRNEWRVEMDRLGAFRKECCIEDASDEGLSVQARPFYVAYRKWAEEAGERPLTETAFGLRMSECGFRKVRDAKNIRYVGIALKDLFHG